MVDEPLNCKICGGRALLFGRAQILKRYMVAYYHCEDCGFIQTERPYWMEQAYSSAISISDIGLISRNLEFSKLSQNLITSSFNVKEKFIDFGGGYGLFVRLMRDQGFDFYRYDPFCENLFAEGFDAVKDAKYELLTAWEVFEHLVEPLPEIEKMLSFSTNIFFSTLLLPKTPIPLDKWWYYGLAHGQHVAFYSKESLHVISEKYGLKVLYSDGFVHWIGKKDIHPALVSIIFSKRFGFLRKAISKYPPPSLLPSDFQRLTGGRLE